MAISKLWESMSKTLSYDAQHHRKNCNGDNSFSICLVLHHNIVVAISVIIWRLRGTYRSNRRALHNRSQQAQQKITKATKEKPKQSSLETSNIPIERLQFLWHCRAQPFTNCLDRGLKRPSTDRLYLFCFCYFVFYYVYYLCICEQAFGYIFRIFEFFFNK